jgi:adenylate kinase
VQAYILEGLMIKLNTSLNCLINLNVPEDISAARLIKRAESSGRADDNEEVIRNRLREYHEKTLPVLEFYREKGQEYDLDATRPVDVVREDIVRIVLKEFEKNLFNLVLFGYPGSGRSSQGLALAEKFGLEYVSTARMIRQEIEKHTEIGMRIHDIYEAGELVPDEIVVRLVEKKISTPSGARGFIFKGIPRTLVQSYILDGMLRKHGSGISKIINLEVPVLEVVRRLDERSRTDRAMPYDANTATIVRRIEEHESKTVPVISKYRQHREVINIDGRGTFEEVFERLSNVVDAGMHTSL